MANTEVNGVRIIYTDEGAGGFTLLLMHGLSADSNGRAAWEQRLFKHPASHSLEWEGFGHRLHVERPRELAYLIDVWLARLAGEGPTSQSTAATGKVK